MTKDRGLIYIGWGSLPGIPARNLSPQEVKEYGGEEYLLSTKLYAKPPEEDKKPRGSRDKAIRGPSRNK